MPNSTAEASNPKAINKDEIARLENEVERKHELVTKLTHALEVQNDKVKLQKKILKDREGMVTQLISEKDELAKAVAERDRKILSLQNDLYVYGTSKKTVKRKSAEETLSEVSPEDTASPSKGEGKQNKRGRSPSHDSISVEEAAKKLARAHPKSPADPETVAKILGTPSKDEAAKKRFTNKSPAAKKSKADKLVSNVELAPHIQRKSQVLEIPAEPADDLPEGWLQKKIPRTTGKGHDNYFFSPNLNIRLSSKKKAKKFISMLSETDGDEAAAWSLVKDEGAKGKSKHNKGRKSKRKLQEMEEHDDGDKPAIEEEVTMLSPKTRRAKANKKKLA
ncbi:hypothetical protein ACHAWO_011905 [Cyclotella atomus]|uniref:Uncharacterized protein n=1 Tax=Cyclotella atomus TaxID=382360 RepID=A0ABD3NI78_9STRA